MRIWSRQPATVDTGRRQVRYGAAAGPGGRPIAGRTSGQPVGRLAGRGGRGRSGGRRSETSARRRGIAGFARRDTRRIEAVPVQQRWIRERSR